MNQKQQEIVPLAKVDHLAVTFYTPTGVVHAVRDASFEIMRSQVFGLVGESGCGKSTAAYAIMGYLQGVHKLGGQISFEGRDITKMSASEVRKLRGDRIAMVYQDPATSLNPSMRIGPQIEEVLQTNLKFSYQRAHEHTAKLFESVGLADPGNIGKRYPHELSGGMQQRVVIAMALACDPDLLIMDEPTTGLDVTTEATILDLVVDLKKRVRSGILFVSHNLGVIARVADRVAVMYAGQVVEQAPVRELFKNTHHPYTTGLLSCVPRPISEGEVTAKLTSIPGSVYEASKEDINACLFASRCPIAHDQCWEKAPEMFNAGSEHESRCFFWNDVQKDLWENDIPREGTDQEGSLVLSANNLRKFYGHWQRKYFFFGPRVKPPVRALVDVDFNVKSGRTLGIVGESGSGKSTMARTVVGLIPRNRGELHLHGKELAPEVEKRNQQQRNAMRMVFQNPTASLNPQIPISHVIFRSLQKLVGLNRRESRERAAELLQAVGLDPAYLERLPGELSGGEQQRVALAGAFAGNAEIIIADEAVSSLDVSVQAQVLDLLGKHQKEMATSYIFISHDLAVVRYVSDDIMVLYAGHVAESGPIEFVLKPPMHPYTEALLSAAPTPDPDASLTTIRLVGAVPTLLERFQGCFFAERCPRKIGDICDQVPPPARINPYSNEHTLYCHIPLDQLTEMQSTNNVT